VPKFGIISEQNLSTCHPKLQELFREVIKYVDCRVICGHRGEAEQNAAFEAHRSMVRFPNSKHNSTPSMAIDVVPYPVEWEKENMNKVVYGKTLGRLYFFVGYVRATADRLGVKVRCGADWDGDFNLKDQTFDDLPHVELVED